MANRFDGPYRTDDVPVSRKDLRAVLSLGEFGTVNRYNSPRVGAAWDRLAVLATEPADASGDAS